MDNKYKYIIFIIRVYIFKIIVTYFALLLARLIVFFYLRENNPNMIRCVMLLFNIFLSQTFRILAI